MTCFNPRRLFYSDPELCPGQKVTADVSKALDPDSPIFVPCGKCIGCKSSRARDWSSRLWCESTFHDFCWFLTLTYSDEFCPNGLEYSHVQKFLKRLRKKVGKLRFFCCGEYGSQNLRPHWHLLLFGPRFDDLVPLPNRDGYVSPLVASLWPFGHHLIGSVTPASIRYVVKYQLKDGLTPPPGPDGEVPRRPFITMSRRPGIGAQFVDSWSSDLKRDFRVRVAHSFQPLPRYFTKRLGLDFELSRRDRVESLSCSPHFQLEQTPARRAARESVAVSRSEFFKKGTL